jgi:hypothetical protein
MLALAGGFFDGLCGLVLSHKLALRQVNVSMRYVPVVCWDGQNQVELTPAGECTSARDRNPIYYSP